MKEKTKGILVLLCLILIVIFLIYLLVFVMLPEQEAYKLKRFKDNQDIKRGVIILVEPDEAVYFKDGSIMKQWQREDYAEFRKHIGMEVTITYGEIDDYTFEDGERKLFKIVETPIGGQVKTCNNK